MNDKRSLTWAVQTGKIAIMEPTCKKGRVTSPHLDGSSRPLLPSVLRLHPAAVATARCLPRCIKGVFGYTAPSGVDKTQNIQADNTQPIIQSQTLHYE